VKIFVFIMIEVVIKKDQLKLHLSYFVDGY